MQQLRRSVQCGLRPRRARDWCRGGNDQTGEETKETYPCAHERRGLLEREAHRQLYCRVGISNNIFGKCSIGSDPCQVDHVLAFAEARILPCPASNTLFASVPEVQHANSLADLPLCYCLRAYGNDGSRRFVGRRERTWSSRCTLVD